ncbi:MAG: [citrate (pro-3S)-lyase] ligase [Eubacteriaceae bacterium]
MSNYLEFGHPFKNRKLDKLKDFLKDLNLDYDETITFTANLCDETGKLLGTGSCHHNVLKCIGVSKEYQGEGFLNRIMTELLNNCYNQGYTNVFLFTKPCNQGIFQDLGFFPIINNKHILLMENQKNGIQTYLENESKRTPNLENQSTIGAVVINANPFTKGHQYLIESALKHCDFLHVFVLENDASDFPTQVRLSLVNEGCSHFKNVCVHESSEYLISYATYPDYFLKDKIIAGEAAGALDLEIFCQYFCPAFNISIRFVGEEPFCKTTNAYNKEMKKILPKYHIDLMEIPRLEENGLVISASFIRKEFLKGKASTLKPYLPPTTYAYLNSLEGEELRQTILNKK